MDDQIIQEFFAEINMAIDESEKYVMAMENGDMGGIDAVFRCFHNIKGTAAMLELLDLKELTHAAEDVISLLKNKELEPESRVISVLLVTIDLIKACAESPHNTDFSDTIKELKAVSEREMLKIMVVDDESITCELLQSFVATYGICNLVHDGMEAIAQFENSWSLQKPYDLIFLDLNMPGTNGYQVLEYIRKWEEKNHITIKAGVRVIIITAAREYEKIRKAFEKQCEAVVLKPLKKENILNEMHKLRLIKSSPQIVNQ